MVCRKCLDRAILIVDQAIGDGVFGATGPLYQCGNETMAMVNQGLLLLVPIGKLFPLIFLIQVQKLINPTFAAHW